MIIDSREVTINLLDIQGKSMLSRENSGAKGLGRAMPEFLKERQGEDRAESKEQVREVKGVKWEVLLIF